MLRKWTVSFTLLLLLSLGLAACGEQDPAPEQTPSVSTTQPEESSVSEPEPEEPSLAQLRAILAEGDALCGISFLGNLPEGDPANLPDLIRQSGCLEDYPFLEHIPQEQVIAYEGTEVYCLVPRDLAAGLTVQEFISNEANHYQGQTGQTLYHSDQGNPVILIGNISDVIPNLQVTLTGEDGQELIYTPSLSLCDGTVDLPVSGNVYDFSNYQSMEEAPVSTDFLGTWQADGGRLTFSSDGTMTFAPVGSAGQMTGTFYVISNSTQYPAGSVLFEMAGDGFADFWGIFTLARSGDTLVVTNVSGDQLLDSQTAAFDLAG